MFPTRSMSRYRGPKIGKRHPKSALLSSSASSSSSSSSPPTLSPVARTTSGTTLEADDDGGTESLRMPLIQEEEHDVSGAGNYEDVAEDDDDSSHASGGEGKKKEEKKNRPFRQRRVSSNNNNKSRNDKDNDDVDDDSEFSLLSENTAEEEEEEDDDDDDGGHDGDGESQEEEEEEENHDDNGSSSSDLKPCHVADPAEERRVRQVGGANDGTANSLQRASSSTDSSSSLEMVLASLQEQWDNWEQKFADREKQLSSIIQGRRRQTQLIRQNLSFRRSASSMRCSNSSLLDKDSGNGNDDSRDVDIEEEDAFIALLKQHEVQVRAKAKEQLLLNMLSQLRAARNHPNQAETSATEDRREDMDTTTSNHIGPTKSVNTTTTTTTTSAFVVDDIVRTKRKHTTSGSILRRRRKLDLSGTRKSLTRFFIPAMFGGSGGPKSRTAGADRRINDPTSRNFLSSAESSDDDDLANTINKNVGSSSSSAMAPPNVSTEKTRRRRQKRGHLHVSEDNLIDALEKCRSGNPETGQDNVRSWWWETSVFEMYTTLPAIYSIVFYDVAHYAIYNSFSYVVETISKGIYDVKNLTKIHVLYVVLFVLGYWLMRFSGYLYWFLSPIDYKCVKFDYHNRLRLGKWDAKILKWVVQRDVLRCILFTAGYYLCYMAVEWFISTFVSAMFNQKDTVLADLPSRKYAKHATWKALRLGPEGSTYYTASSTPFSRKCKAHIDALEERYEELKEADVWYTYGILSSSSYGNYWYSYNEGLDAADGGPLMTATTEVLICISSVVLSIVALSTYGFKFFCKY